MTALRYNKVIGLALGERSLLAAEITAGEPPNVTQLAEFAYPPAMSLDQPAELARSLAVFLREHHFSAKTVVVGLPARWLVVKPKEVPPADASTLADLLRIQAEGEFSSELKDLVYDYAGNPAVSGTNSVLLIATHRKYVDQIKALCEGAKLNPAVVTASAMALGAATGRALSKTSLVLAVSGSGAELTAQVGESSIALRHLRGPGPDRSFMGELRRAVSNSPNNGDARELVLWDSSGLDADSLAKDLGFNVRSGDLALLGVGTSEANRNGQGRRFAAAVSLGLIGIGKGRPAVDFLHSRLAPVKARFIPPWAIGAAVAVLLLVGGIVYAYSYLHQQQADLDTINRQLAAEQSDIASATAFVSKVSLASAWHGGKPRYLACLRDLTIAIPDDEQTFAISLILREIVKAPAVGATSAAKTNDVPTLGGLLAGKTTDQQRVQKVIDGMKRMPAVFTDVKLVNADSSRGREVAFSVSFIYVPAKTTP